jgi:O-antigen/teichoic acid export membrane protein
MSKEGFLTWVREAFWVGFGLGISVLALLVGTRLLTTLLSTEEYGKLALSISLATLAVQVGATPISQMLIRFYSDWRNNDKLSVLLRNVQGFTAVALTLVLTATLITALFGPWIEGFPGAGYVLLIGIFAAQLVLNRIAFALEDAARARRARAIIQGAFEVGRFALAFGFIYLSGRENAAMVFVGFVVAGFMAMIAHVFFLKKQLGRVVSWNNIQIEVLEAKDRSAMRSFLWPLIVSNACIWIVMMAERWSLQSFGSLADVGGYAAVYQLAFMPMMLVSNFLLLLSTPIIYQMIGTDQRTDNLFQALKINRYIAVIVLVFSFVGALFLLKYHSLIGQFFLGPDFRQYSWMFPWLLFAGGCFAAAQQLLLKLTCEFRTLPLAFLWGAVAIVAVCTYTFSAYFWKLQGVFVSVVAINAALLLISFFLSCRIRRN